MTISRAVEHWARVSPLAVGDLAPRHGLVQRYEPHELAQAIFIESDAAPVFVGKQHRTCPAEHAPVAVLLTDAADGDASALDALLTHADQLLADGNPLGQLLNWALLLWLREPADLTHADEAVRWLEWLTAQHELMRNRNASNYTVTVDGHEYSVTAHDSMTASEIAAALNEQGGPATFTANEDGGIVVTTINHGATNSTLIVAGSFGEADLLPIPQVSEEPTRRQHASHIGSRLGRRLGVRR